MPDNDGTPNGVKAPDGSGGEPKPGDQKWYEKLGEEDVITPRKLQGIISANTATLEKRLDTKLGELNKGLSDVVKEALKAEKESSDEGKKTGKTNEQEAEMALLKRKLEEAEGKITSLVTNLDESKLREMAISKRQLIMNALTKSECSKPEMAYKCISDDVHVEDGKAFVLQDNGYGAEEQVPLDEFVQVQVREKLLPELFRGANRGGSPASGDESGDGAKGFKYDWEKVKANMAVLTSDEFTAALNQGLVSNMPKGVAHTTGIH